MANLVKIFGRTNGRHIFKGDIHNSQLVNQMDGIAYIAGFGDELPRNPQHEGPIIGSTVLKWLELRVWIH